MSEFLSTLSLDYLPEHILEDLILHKAVRKPTSHISPIFKKYFSDLLFEIPLRSGGTMSLYFLIEHKSYYDRLVPFQILKNMVAVIEEQKKYFQPIIGILFYHGGTEWNIPLSFQEAVGYSDATREKFGRFMPEFEFVSIRVREDQLVQKVQPIRIKVYLSVLLISDAKDQDKVFLEFLRISVELRKTKEGLYYFDILLGYAKVIYKGDIAKLAKKVGKIMGVEMADTVMTEGGSFYIEGQILARAEGEAIGIEIGETNGKEQVAQNLIEAGSSPELIQKVTGLSRLRLVKLGMPQE